jgi:hypothetical protein
MMDGMDSIDVQMMKLPEKSDWQAVICGVTYKPYKGQEPNRFHRWMQRLAFGIKWERAKG